MVVQHNIMAINSHRQLGINNTNLSSNLEKLSSGYRINRAADDAAGLAISEKMRAQITGLDRAVLNAQDASSLIQVAEGALTEVHDMLNRMVELSMQDANGTMDTSTAANDRQKIQDEIDALLSEIDRIAQSTNFNGLSLLSGSFALNTGTLTMQVGDSGNTWDKIQVNIDSMRTSSISSTYGQLSTLGNSFMLQQSNAMTAVDVIKGAIEYVSKNRSALGALQNRLEHTINNLNVASENMTAAESRIRDTDMAKEMMDFTKNNVLAQAAQSMLAQANQQPQQVLQLLR